MKYEEKSTFFNLITGINIPTDGNVFINDIPIGDYNLATYWRSIGYVMQRTQFFKDTIKKNMFYEGNDSYLEDVAKCIDIFNEIDALPKSWETEIKQIHIIFRKVNFAEWTFCVIY